METGTNPRSQYAKYSRYFRQLIQVYEKKPEVKTSIELLLTLLAISFFSIFALRPTINTIFELLANIHGQEQTQEAMLQKVKNLDQAQDTWTKETSRRFLVEQALPKDPQPDHYLRQIEGLVARHNITLKSFSTDKVVILGKDTEKKSSSADKTETGSFNVVLSISGDYPSLMSFLKDLEVLRRIIKIDSLSFAKGVRDEDSVLSLTISGGVPYYNK